MPKVSHLKEKKLGFFLPPRPMKMPRFIKKINAFFLSIKELKRSIKEVIYLYFLGQDIHLSDFPEKHLKNYDLLFNFFKTKIGGGSRLFYSTFLSVLD